MILSNHHLKINTIFRIFSFSSFLKNYFESYVKNISQIAQNWVKTPKKLKIWGILRICNQKCSKRKLKIYFFTKSFFVDLVILDIFYNWNILLKSLFTRQEIGKLFDVVKQFVDFLMSKWWFQLYTSIMKRV